MLISNVSDTINLIKFLANSKRRKEWIWRIKTVRSSSDNKYIQRVANAGKIEGNNMIMHNGIKVGALSYYGFSTKLLLYANKGVHEPQEERVFQEMLKSMKKGATFIELGSFWSFYSIWFKKEIDDAKCYMVEPELCNLECGKSNFILNGIEGDFTHAFVGSYSTNKEGIQTIGIDEFVKEKSIEFIDVLHADIQGYEFEMLKGAVKTLKSKNVGYLFISTHSNELHEACLNFLTELGYLKIASANLDESFSFDGLLVMINPDYEGIEPVNISIRK